MIEGRWVTVYKTSTDLFPEVNEETWEYWYSVDDNMVELWFPDEIVRAYYEQHRAEFDAETNSDLGVPLEDCTFEKWVNEVYLVEDMDGLFDFAEQRGFRAKLPDDEQED